MSSIPSLKTIAANVVFENDIDYEDVPIDVKELIERLYFDSEYKKYLNNKAKELAKAGKRQHVRGRQDLPEYDDNLEKVLIAIKCKS
jgi:hypothetical protein